MRANTTRTLDIWHAHGDIGPDSRPHSHQWRVTVSYEGVFDARTGRFSDFDIFEDFVSSVVASYAGRDLLDVAGMRPTMESLALRVREDMLSAFPKTGPSPLRVSISDSDRGIDVP